jgi:type I restriction enzyme S subunit
LSRLNIKGLPKSIDLKNSGRTLVLEQGNLVIAGFVDQAADVKASRDAPKFVFGDHTCRMRLSTVPFSVFPNTIVLESKLVNTYWAFQATKGLQGFETYRRHWMELAYKVVTVPTAPLAEAFGSLAGPLFAQIDALMLESRTLGELRDAVLPRLISGELKIPKDMLAP